jgi:multidrug efflux pump subunit AcrA (membrane-fusion protein)
MLNIPHPPYEDTDVMGTLNGLDGPDTLDGDESAVEVEDLPRKSKRGLRSRLVAPGTRRLRTLARPTLVFVPARFRSGWVRWAWLGVLVALVAVLVVVVLQARAPQIQTARVTSGNLTLSFTTSGNLQGASYAANFTGSGKVAEIDVTVGQQVEQGNTLAKLDTTQLQDALNEAQAAVNGAQTQLSDAQAAQQRVQAKTAADVAAAYDQEQHAIDQCASTDSACVLRAQDTYAAAQAQADSENADAQTQVDSAQSSLSTAQAKAQTAQDNLNGATLTASHGGTIAAINGSVGATVIGSNATAPVASFITIADLGALQLASSVPIAHIGAVAQNNAVQFTVPSLGSQVFQGKVDGVSPVAQGTNSLSYPMTIDVDMQSVQNAHLFPGMTASITVITQQRFGVHLIPAGAVTFAKAAADTRHGGFLTHQQVTQALTVARQMQLDMQAGGTDVSADNPTAGYIVQRHNNTWVVKPVVLGLTDGSSYEVLSGLSVGDTVVRSETNGPVAG